jgi:dTDP-4-amino-4,6-dideoxygalactose transaminase
MKIKVNPIPLVDLRAQYSTIKDEIGFAISEVLTNTRFIDMKGEAFLPHFAEFVGCRSAVGCNSGTDALIIALRVLGIGRGDEVILPANTFIATAEAVSAAGAKPVFVDAVEQTALIDPTSIESMITLNTKAIIPVHLFGLPADMQEILSIGKKHGIHIIEDCAQSHGATYKGKPTGSFGICSCFSFYPGKNLGAFGDGGAVTTSDPELAELLKKWTNHGGIKKYVHEFPALNSRLDGLQVAVLGVKLRHLPAWNEARRRIAARYAEMLQGVGDLQFFSEPGDRCSVYHLFVIRTKHREDLLQHLHEKQIFAGIHYPDPLHLTPAYADPGHPAGSLPVSEKLCREILSLPIYPELNEEQQDRVVAEIAAFFEGK